MKSLYDCILESVKIVAKNNSHDLITLVTRTGIDCKNLTKDEFCEMMYADLEEAQDQYSRLVYDLRKQKIAQRIDNMHTYNRDRASVRYKRKSNQEKYASKLNWRDENRRMQDILSADSEIHFNFHLRQYGFNSVSVDGLRAGTDRKKMEKCFEEVSTSQWWEHGTGWQLTYLANKGSVFPCHYWGEIILLMDEKKMAEKRDADEALDRALLRYYDEKGSGGYCGD